MEAVTEEKNRPALDEHSFEKLLEAAYVLQEHNRKMRELEQSLESQSEQLREQERRNQERLQRNKPQAEERARANGDYTLTLAEIVEAQHQIQMRHLELDQAMAVVAERVSRITGGNGAGIGLLEAGTVRYRAAAGESALPVGSEVPLQKAVCQANIRTGQVIRTPDVSTEFLFDPDPCRQRGILSLLAVPIHYDGNIVGALELYFDRLKGFAEQDIHTCQLMAGLVTEAIGRDAELKIKKSMVAERSSMLEAIERLQPNLAALAGDRSAVSSQANAAPAAKNPCWKCGDSLLAEEQFCGKCGAPRAGETDTSSLQSKVASAWRQQSAKENAGTSREALQADHFPEAIVEAGEVESLAASAGDDDVMPESYASKSAWEAIDEENSGSHHTALEKPHSEELVWSSAAKARDFLESLAEPQTPGALARFLRSRRGDFYMILAIILVIAVVRWGVWSDSPAVASGHGAALAGGATRSRKPAPDADLSLFDKFLISIGLAEAPETPQFDKGNPDVQVWVDLQTALYYCPGSDLYGKTPKGKLSSQRQAQLDQFEPAKLKACD
jgi:putative methionine-R-sulfoxide reductase with GAF domain